MANQTPSNMITLFCWVIGDERPFSIEIDRNETIDNLKKAIVAMDPDRFHLAYKLTLFKKFLLINQLGTIQKSDLGPPLSEFDNLSERFDRTLGKGIHVVVTLPPSK